MISPLHKKLSGVFYGLKIYLGSHVVYAPSCQELSYGFHVTSLAFSPVTLSWPHTNHNHVGSVVPPCTQIKAMYLTLLLNDMYTNVALFVLIKNGTFSGSG